MARSTALAEARSVNTAPTHSDLYRHFDLYVPNMLAWLNDRFDIDDDGCWIWRGTPITSMGYGQANIGPRDDHLRIYAHRLSYMIHHGDPGPAWVLHRCDKPLCIRPEDLYAGTQSDSARQSVAKGRHRNQNNTGREICQNGHPLEGEHVRIESTGFRRCVTCQREYQRQWRAINR